MFMLVQGSSDKQADLLWCVRDVLIGWGSQYAVVYDILNTERYIFYFLHAHKKGFSLAP